MTIVEKVSHSANSALFTLYKEGLFYRLSCKYLKPSDYQSEGFFFINLHDFGHSFRAAYTISLNEI